MNDRMELLTCEHEPRAQQRKQATTIHTKKINATHRTPSATNAIQQNNLIFLIAQYLYARMASNLLIAKVAMRLGKRVCERLKCGRLRVLAAERWKTSTPICFDGHTGEFESFKISCLHVTESFRIYSIWLYNAYFFCHVSRFQRLKKKDR